MSVRTKIWLIFAVFLGLRLVFAFRLPIFNDESTYMRWGIGFMRNPSQWWAWMLDGKQPAVALTYGLAQLLPVDPLISMRFASILWSCVTFVTVYALVRRFFLKTSVVWTLLIMACCPYLILFDTLALAESPITAVFVMLLYLSLSMSQNPTVLKGLLMGILFALGWWYKTTVYLTVPLIGMTLLILSDWKKKPQIILAGLGMGAIAAVIIMMPVLANPALYAKAQVITRTNSLGQIMSTSWLRWLILAKTVTDWFIGFLGPLGFLFSLAGFWMLRKHKEFLVLFLWAVFPVVTEIIMLTSMSGRLLVICVIPMIISAGYCMAKEKLHAFTYAVIGTTVLIGVMIAWSPVSYYRLVSFLPGAGADFSQYVVGWPSGWGVKEAVVKLQEIGTARPIVVFVRFDGGNPEDAVLSYMMRARIPVFYLEQMEDVAKVPGATGREWYFVSRGNQYKGLKPYLSEIAVYKKPLDDEFIGVYRINKK